MNSRVLQDPIMNMYNLINLIKSGYRSIYNLQMD